MRVTDIPRTLVSDVSGKPNERVESHEYVSLEKTLSMYDSVCSAREHQARPLIMLCCLRIAVSGLAIYLAAAGANAADTKRPPIIGVAHIALGTSDSAGAKQFYGYVLGMGEFSAARPEAGSSAVVFKVNGH